MLVVAESERGRFEPAAVAGVVDMMSQREWRVAKQNLPGFITDPPPSLWTAVDAGGNRNHCTGLANGSTV